MDLENWRHIYRLSATSLSLMGIVMGLPCIFLLPRLNPHFKLLCYYFIFSLFAELYTWVLTYFDLLERYGTTINHPFIIVEALLIGAFYCQIVGKRKQSYVIVFLLTIVILFEIYVIVFKGITSDSQYGSGILSGSLCLAGLITLRVLSTEKVSKSFLTRPETQVVFGFTCIYALIVFIYLILPSTIEYSRILANQLLVLKNVLSIISLAYICYGMWLKYKQLSRLTPTASPKPSLPSRGTN
jgi:hypothetical protein